MKTFLAFLVTTSMCAVGQNFAVLLAKDRPGTPAGFPGEWPTRAALVGAVKDPGAPWVLMTKAELDALRAANSAAKEVINQTQDTDSSAPKRDRDAIIRQAKADLTTIVESSGTLTGAQLSSAVRALARILRALVEDLGY